MIKKNTLPEAFAIPAGGNHEGPQIYEFDFTGPSDTTSRSYARQWVLMAHETAREFDIKMDTKKSNCGLKVRLAMACGSEYSRLMNAFHPKFVENAKAHEERMDAYVAKMVDEHYGDHIPAAAKDDDDYTPSKEMKRDRYAEQALESYGDELTQDYGHDDGYTLSR